jgi:hypothetical protein
MKKVFYLLSFLMLTATMVSAQLKTPQPSPVAKLSLKLTLNILVQVPKAARYLANWCVLAKCGAQVPMPALKLLSATM